MEDKVPISFAVTQFHIILVYSDCYLVVNRLNQNCVQYDKVPQGEKVGDIGVADNFIYVMTETKNISNSTIDESRDVWQLFLDKKDFQNAKKFARNTYQKSKY